MKNQFIFKSLLLILALSLLVLTGCAAKSNSEDKQKDTNQKQKKQETILKVSASSVPHAEILEFVAKDLEKEGIKLDILIVSDGIQTNQETYEGTIDANFFQHTPYLEQVNQDAGLDLVNVRGVHIEPFGLYSKKIDSIDALKDGAKIAIPKDPVNFSRALQLFAANNLIQLDREKKGNYTLEDITENKKKFQFIAVEATLLVHSLDDVDASTINTNYALEADFKPLEDSLIIEDDESPYVNILVTTPENKDREPIQKLADALTSVNVRDFIEKEYEGAVVPAF